MTTPAVVILTDPRQCQLAGTEMLIHALLQVQQLNEVGLPASAGILHHPASDEICRGLLSSQSCAANSRY